MRPEVQSCPASEEGEEKDPGGGGRRGRRETEAGIPRSGLGATGARREMSRTGDDGPEGGTRMPKRCRRGRGCGRRLRSFAGGLDEGEALEEQAPGKTQGIKLRMMPPRKARRDRRRRRGVRVASKQRRRGVGFRDGELGLRRGVTGAVHIVGYGVGELENAAQSA